MSSSKTQKKIWMISAVAEAMRALPGIGPSTSVTEACTLSEDAKKLLSEGNEEQARAKAAEGLKALEQASEILPKTAKKMIKTQLKKIAAY